MLGTWWRVRPTREQTYMARGEKSILARLAVGFHHQRRTSSYKIGCASSGRLTARNFGKIHNHKATVTKTAQPPTTTDPTAPSHAAITPARNEPSWPEQPMKNELTPPTRPRISSGVVTCTMVWRTTALTMSPAPSTISATSESATLVERPNTVVPRP